MDLYLLTVVLLVVCWLGTAIALLADRRARARAWRDIAAQRRRMSQGDRTTTSGDGRGRAG